MSKFSLKCSCNILKKKKFKLKKNLIKYLKIKNLDILFNKLFKKEKSYFSDFLILNSLL